MLFNATFNNISVISWRSVLLMEETGVPGENNRPATSNWQTWSHNGVSSIPSSWAGFELTTLVVIGTDYIGSCKSNYLTLTTTTAPLWNEIGYEIRQLYLYSNKERGMSKKGCAWLNNGHQLMAKKSTHMLFM